MSLLDQRLSDLAGRLGPIGGRAWRYARRGAALAQRGAAPAQALWRRFAQGLKRMMPTGLFGRSLLIIITPMVVLQFVVTSVFMERHWNSVTGRLSAGVSQDIAALIDLYEASPDNAAQQALLKKIAVERLSLTIEFLPGEALPPPGPKPFFSLLDYKLSREISRRINRPFWIDTVGRSEFIEIRIKLEQAILQVITRRSQAYASNSEIFLIWMAATSLILIVVAVLFLRNQIRPILRLADAAEDFGKGREVAEFRPAGAREVRAAARAFIAMRRRIERQIEQRTTMLAGVSHDMRTILTRFKLELAMLPPGPDTEGMRKDVEEMGRMLEAYLGFARGEDREASSPTDMRALIAELSDDAERQGHRVATRFSGEPVATVRPAAFRRLLTNLIWNAARYGSKVEVTGQSDDHWLAIHVDDDGPGIPPEQREEVFRPFYRLDEARNQDSSGTGLGLSIARDVARTHGGDVTLGDSPLGGLRATVRVPV